MSNVLASKSDLELESDLRELKQQFENENNHVTELWHIILDYQNELKKRESLMYE